ncbi:shikimate dehydrogenase [Roseiterribacter gracilis]|uniref:Shikimate dehydrogenase (NADP(+)) n=1 Tax=Roseiterribacter gracilis TaxID=2812848 RepID=A0A8S8XDG3_9PROT|nr:shikimate dehydrogenase (NADP(+)) [Rhodospirillales bacterium TMPK1]
MKRAGVIGWPIAQSRSPRLHGHWLQRYGVAGSYEAIAIPPDRLQDDVRRLASEGWAGLNVTIPHKERVVSLLDEVHPSVARTGSCNLLVFRDGKIEGRSTDGDGFVANLRAGAPAWNGGVATVLGAGGASLSVIDALQRAGARVRVANRTAARAEALAEKLGNVDLFHWGDWDFSDSALLVNATSLGMTGHDPLDVSLDSLPRDAVVTDLVYAPLETPLLAAARARGNVAVDGLGMLLHQAVPAFETWFGVRPVVDDALRRAVLD